MKTFFYLFLLITLSLKGFSQTDYIWEKTYGGSYDDVAECIIEITDGYLVGGWTKSSGNGGKDAMILKLDFDGNEIWKKVFGDSQDDFCKTIVPSSDGNYVAAGIKTSVTSGYADLWIFKFSPSGDLLWERNVQGTHKGNYYQIATTSKEEYVILGYEETRVDHDLSMTIVKTDKKGRRIWKQSSQHRFFDDYGKAMLAVNDNSYICTGHIKEREGLGNLYINKFDGRGNSLWSKKVGTEGYESGEAITKAEGGRSIIAGVSKAKTTGIENLFLVSIDGNGAIEWKKTHQTMSSDYPKAIIATNDNAFLITGHTSSEEDTDVWILKIDNRGNEIWEQTFGGDFQERGNAACSTKNGNYVLAGFTKSKGAGGSDFWVVKFSDNPKKIEINSEGKASTNIDKQAPIITITEPTSFNRGFKTITTQERIKIKGRAQDNSGISEITLNGKEILFNKEGYFESSILAQSGENEILIKATDKNKNTKELKLTITRGVNIKNNELTDNTNSDEYDVFANINEIIAASSGKYYALLIGVEKYDDTNISNLNNPISDAMSLYNTITTNYTFEKENVKLLKNPKRSDIIIALDKLSNTITKEDNLLIFYAGHGYWNEKQELGYWFPSDAQKSNTANWLRNSTIRDYIFSIKSNHTLLIADACFSGGIFKTRAAFSDASKAINILHEMPSRKAMTSGTLKEVPDKSVFLEYLIKRLVNNKKKYISSESLFSSFREAVMNNSDNAPQFGTIQNAGDEGGDFIFIKKHN